MKISVITLFPKMVNGFFAESIIKKAQDKKLVEIEIINLRDYAIDSYGTVDDRPYGGGAGMVLRPDVIWKALNQLKVKSEELKVSNENSKILLTSAKGKTFDQQHAKIYSQLDHLTIICGHYEGIDERVMDYIDEEISFGDFVMTGGEIAAAAIVDSVVRLIPGVLKKEKAVKKESFLYTSIDRLIEVVGEDQFLTELKKNKVKEIRLLEYPQYTRPEDFMNKKVPQILLSGNHEKVEEWQIKKSYEETLKKRPDLLKFP